MWFYKITTLLNNLYIYWNYTAESNTACYTLLYLLDTWINVFFTEFQVRLGIYYVAAIQIPTLS